MEVLADEHHVGYHAPQEEKRGEILVTQEMVAAWRAPPCPRGWVMKQGLAGSVVVEGVVVEGVIVEGVVVEGVVVERVAVDLTNRRYSWGFRP